MSKIETLSQLLARFPGVGKKTALRFVYFLLKESPALSIHLAQELEDLHQSIHPCTECGNFTDAELCEICSNAKRHKNQLCIVAHPQDITALEGSQSYFGLYHVLGGLISPLDGIGPEQLRMGILEQKIASGCITEVILATNSTIEGETTARYIYEMCSRKKDTISFTRIAHGIPMGAHFEYVDKVTIAHALRSRLQLE